jgi:hypothetical protein
MAKGTHLQWPLEGGWRHIVAFVLAVLAIAPRVWAAPGDLDPSFGGFNARNSVQSLVNSREDMLAVLSISGSRCAR